MTVTREQLRERRKALGLSQTELAELLGYTMATISRWERGDLEIEHPEALDLALEALERRKADAQRSNDEPHGR